MSDNFWKLERTETVTIWATYDNDYNLIDYYMSFAGDTRHDTIVKIEQDELVMALADKWDTPETERAIKDFERTEEAYKEFLIALGYVSEFKPCMGKPISFLESFNREFL